MTRVFALALALLLSNACSQEDQGGLPPPVAMTADALGHYCQMALSEHPGPKAQIHLVGQKNPIFFAQVRDAVAFRRMPEQSAAIAAVYVNDMGAAESWAAPGADNWIPAEDAYYVAGSTTVGGMGAAELVPFSRRDAAADFAGKNGGQVLRLEEVPDAAVLGPALPVAEGGGAEGYRERLKALSHANGG